MPITPRCNYAGPLGQAIRTRSLAAALASAFLRACRLRR
jgi:hypothetical protein